MGRSSQIGRENSVHVTAERRVHGSEHVIVGDKERFTRAYRPSVLHGGTAVVVAVIVEIATHSFHVAVDVGILGYLEGYSG